MNEFDLQFKIFTLVDTTKSYFILNESMNKLFKSFEIVYAKNHKKQTFKDEVMGQNFSTVINEKS